jgi:hypothetical protein
MNPKMVLWRAAGSAIAILRRAKMAPISVEGDREQDNLKLQARHGYFALKEEKNEDLRIRAGNCRDRAAT